MAIRYDYKVFPETWMGRIMLALAFLAGCGVLVVFALFAGFEREYAPIEGPCPSAYPECMEAETSLTEMSTPTCGEFPPRVCLAPLGRVSPELVTHLVEYYEGEYGLSIQVITPAAIPEGLMNEDRGQVDILDLQELMLTRFPGGWDNSYSVVIAITSVDVYISDSNWRYAFGKSYPAPIISTVRMDPAAYGYEPDYDRYYSRVRKMVTKYIGLWYYDLEVSDDPDSPMFNNILGPADLDRMDEPLPVADAR